MRGWAKHTLFYQRYVTWPLHASTVLLNVTLRWVTTGVSMSSWFVTSQSGRLRHLPSVEWEMSTTKGQRQCSLTGKVTTLTAICHRLYGVTTYRLNGLWQWEQDVTYSTLLYGDYHLCLNQITLLTKCDDSLVVKKDTRVDLYEVDLSKQKLHIPPRLTWNSSLTTTVRVQCWRISHLKHW